MADRLFGVETEYAITGMSPDGAMDREPILQRLMAHAGRQLVQLPDLNSSGGFFLGNGSRFYVDCGNHPEICTPECVDPRDAVRYIEAGHAHSAPRGLPRSPPPARREPKSCCFRCNVDYSGNQTPGAATRVICTASRKTLSQPQIIPHLVTRLIYTGAGGFNPLSRGLEFSLAPRMAHFRRLVTERLDQLPRNLALQIPSRFAPATTAFTSYAARASALRPQTSSRSARPLSSLPWPTRATNRELAFS